MALLFAGDVHSEWRQQRLNGASGSRIRIGWPFLIWFVEEPVVAWNHVLAEGVDETRRSGDTGSPGALVLTRGEDVQATAVEYNTLA